MIIRGKIRDFSDCRQTGNGFVGLVDNVNDANIKPCGVCGLFGF